MYDVCCEESGGCVLEVVVEVEAQMKSMASVVKEGGEDGRRESEASLQMHAFRRQMMTELA